jgi:hypothetical protein
MTAALAPRPCFWRQTSRSVVPSRSEGSGMRWNPLVVCMALVFLSTTIAKVVWGGESQPLAFKN